MNRKKRQLGIVIATFVLLILTIVFTIISYLERQIFPVYVTVLSMVAILLISLVFAYYFSQLLQTVDLINTLQIENTHFFGKALLIFNLSTFIKNVFVHKKSFKLRKSEQYLISFSVTNNADIDSFQANDELLRVNTEVANYLSSFSKKYKKTHAFGANQGNFYIYTFGDSFEDIRALVEKIQKKVNEIALENVSEIWIQPFFGVAKALKDQSIYQLIENVNIARERAQRTVNTMILYEERLSRTSEDSILNDVLDGLANDEFIVYYQPKYNLKLKEFTSSEALIRWNSKKYGFTTPGRFIPILEKNNSIVKLDKYVAEKVCEFLVDQKKRGRRLLPVSINISFYELYNPKFFTEVIKMFEDNKLPIQLLQIEVTESTSMANKFLSETNMKKMKEYGVKFLMDDFGTGYSNITSLREMAFDIIKLDKSLIDGIATKENDRNLVKFIIELCHSNGMEVVAEGADNKEQVDILRNLGCDTIQGYYYSQPITKEEYEKLLRENPFEKRKEEQL